jgi:hypothetical protein
VKIGWMLKFNAMLGLKLVFRSKCSLVIKDLSKGNLVKITLIERILPTLEDEAKIILCECFEYVIDLIVKDDIGEKLVFGLMDTLANSDDIECSAISVFSLVQNIMEKLEVAKE